MLGCLRGQAGSEAQAVPSLKRFFRVTLHVNLFVQTVRPLLTCNVQPGMCITRHVRLAHIACGRLLEACGTHRVPATLAMRGAVLASCEKQQLWRSALLAYGMSKVTDLVMANSLVGILRSRWRLGLNLRVAAAPSALARLATWEGGLGVLRGARTQGLQLSWADRDATLSRCPWLRGLNFMGWSLHGVSSVMDKQQKAQQWHLAVRLFGQLQEQSLVPNEVVCSVVVAGVQEFRHWEWAGEMLRVMQLWTRLNSYAFNALMSCCEKAREWRIPLGLQAQMRISHWRLDHFSFASSMSACEKAEQWSWAMWLYHQIQPSSIHLTAALSACSGTWLAAQYLLGAVGRQPELVTVAAAVGAMRPRQPELLRLRGWLDHMVYGSHGLSRLAHREAQMAHDLLEAEGLLSDEHVARAPKAFKLQLSLEQRVCRAHRADAWPLARRWARRRGRCAGHVSAELVACWTMAMLDGSGYRRLTGHREDTTETRARRLKAGEGEGLREPHAERQALLDLVAFAEAAHVGGFAGSEALGRVSLQAMDVREIQLQVDRLKDEVQTLKDLPPRL